MVIYLPLGYLEFYAIIFSKNLSSQILCNYLLVYSSNEYQNWLKNEIFGCIQTTFVWVSIFILCKPQTKKRIFATNCNQFTQKKGSLFAHEIVFTNLSGGNSSEVKSSTVLAALSICSDKSLHTFSLNSLKVSTDIFRGLGLKVRSYGQKKYLVF